MRTFQFNKPYGRTVAYPDILFLIWLWLVSGFQKNIAETDNFLIITILLITTLTL